MAYPAILTEDLLYEQVAKKIEKLIESGVLQAGQRVPSVRTVSRQQRVSVSTAFQAYFLLENKGLIEARPRSGFYVRVSPKHLPPEPKRTTPPTSATNVSIDALISKLFAARRNADIIPLGAATPAVELMPVAKLKRTLFNVVRRDGAKLLDYDFPPGNEALRRQVARRSLEWGGNLSAEDLVVTSGCFEAVNLCLRAVAKPGDAIAIESPTYYGVLQAIESLGMKAVEIATYPRDGLCLDALETALKTERIKACLAIPNFNNPLGSKMPDDKKKALVEMLARRDIPLIEDDLYGDLYFGSERPKTAKAFDKKGLVLLCSSVTKSLAPGYRVGWTAPGRFKAEVERLKFMTNVATATLPQAVVAEFLSSGGYDRHLRTLRAAFASQVQQMTQAVAEAFPNGTKITRPQGGFVLWIELPKSPKFVNALELHRRALEKNISITPGPIFSPKQRYQNFIRLSCGMPWSPRIASAIDTLGSLMK